MEKNLNSHFYPIFDIDIPHVEVMFCKDSLYHGIRHLKMISKGSKELINKLKDDNQIIKNNYV